MITKEKAKKIIRERIEFYSKNKDKLMKISETDTRVKFIDRVLEALGWDVFGKEGNDVLREETIEGREFKKKKADYTLRINEIPKLIVEAKAIKEDLEKEDYIKQAVGYAFNKACSWAVLTDFEGVKIFFVNRDNEMSPFLNIKLADLENFDKNFEDLWFLSRESILNEELEKDAKRRGIKKARVRIDIQLFRDLREWKDELFKEIKKRYPNKYKDEEIEEIVQRIIDRLIFIRKCEDSELEERKLDQLIRKFRDTTNFYNGLKKIFSEYNLKYNSKLFGEEKKKHECDNIEIGNYTIEKVIKGMYRPKNRKIEYNFAAIDADVLGNIYEQYLAYKRYRKEHGIYYTPIYIVNYIVKNTVKEYIKNKKIDEILQTKILDLACGSGSFLIKAFDEVCNVIKEKLKKEEKSKVFTDLKNDKLTLQQKIIIMERCICGVDLDPKAVEIAQLNLLFKLLEGEKHKAGKMLLPTLANIRCGNSLIDDKDVDKKAFKWEEEFPFEFDVIIGNPPWGASIASNEINYYVSNYKIAKKNLNSFELFVRKAVKVLKDNGFFGFVIPKNSIKSNDYTNLRKYILENTLIKKMTLFGTFEGVTQEFVTLIFKKSSQNLDIKNKNKIILNDKDSLSQRKFYENTNYIFNPELKELENIFKKVENGKKLEKYIFIKRGEEISKKGEIFLCYSCNHWFPASKREKKNCPYCNKELSIAKCQKYEMISKKKDSNHSVPIVTGEDISRYKIKIRHYFDCNKKGISYKNKDMYIGSKLMMNKIASTFRVGYIDKDCYCTQNVYIIKSLYNDKNKLKILLALFNSKLWRYYYEKKFNLGAKITTAISLNNVKKLNFPHIEKKILGKIIKLVDKMLSLSKKVNELGNKKTDERFKIEKEIERIDKQIDQEVYKIYDITKEEQKTIEESLK